MSRRELYKVGILAGACILAAQLNADPLRGATGGHLGLPERPQFEQRLDTRARESMTASEAISIAERRYGGRAVGAQKAGSGYRVRILQDNGKIKNVTID
ncbi:MAG: PepSY domain-containing protein [Zhongshania sp.]|uniref:PepSY domain-containing protein n=1 Tax=Zhongshania sp. TaxID=1971902 RepID=UPI00260F7995|nr:PepSY domain-containing protein [Zhongshania sp.]MDF1692027.1 PepSY domain-containing protein [Zhongshania sp.]